MFFIGKRVCRCLLLDKYEGIPAVDCQFDRKRTSRMYIIDNLDVSS